MKISKKIFLAAITAAAVAFVGCGMSDGEGDLDGSKWNATMTVDATTESGNEMAEDAVYRRYWKQLGSKEGVASVDSVIKIDFNEAILKNDADKKVVVGYIFDLNINPTNEELIDFCLLGFQPATGMYYFERYTGVPKVAEGSLDTDNTVLGGECESLDGKTSGNFVNVSDKDLNNMYVFTKVGEEITAVEVKISVTQETPGKYVVKVGNKVVGSYERDLSSKYTDDIDGTKYLVGGLACYANVPKDCKVVVNYQQNKDTLKGALFAEPVEE